MALDRGGGGFVQGPSSAVLVFLCCFRCPLSAPEGLECLALLRQGCCVFLQGCLRPSQQPQVLADLQKQLSLPPSPPPPKNKHSRPQSHKGSQ